MPIPAPISSLRVSFWEWLQVGVLLLNLGWTTLCLGGVRPETMVVTSLLTGLLLTVHLIQRAGSGPAAGATRFQLQADLAHWRQQSRAPGRWHPAGIVLLPFLGYAAANVMWMTPVQWLGWDDWLLWAQMIAVFWVVINDLHSPLVRQVIFGGLLVLGLITVSLGVYQRFVQPDWLMLGRIQAAQFIGRSSGAFGIPNSQGAFLLLLLTPTAALAFCQRRFWARVGFAACAFFFAAGLVLTISRGAWLGLAFSLAAWPLLAGRRSWGWRLGGAAVTLIGIIAVGAALYVTLPGVRARLDTMTEDKGEKTRPVVWRAAWQIFRDHPVTGSGAGSYNVVFERYRPEHFRDEPQWAHNEYLNTLSDYGGVGFLLFFGVCGLIVWRCVRSGNLPPGSACGEKPASSSPGALLGALDEPLVRQAGAIGILAFGFQLFVDFHFKIPALGMIFATVRGLLVTRAWSGPAEPAAGSAKMRLVFGTVALTVAIVLTVFVLPHYRSDAARYGIRRKMDAYALNPVSVEFERELLARAKIEFARAVERDPSNAQAWADRAYAMVAWAHHEPARAVELGREAEGYARRALALSAAVPEFWVRLGTTLDLQGLWVEAGASFVEALRLAPANAPMWYYQAYHFTLKASTRPLAKAAIATCLRLDPGNRDAEALRRRLAVSH